MIPGRAVEHRGDAADASRFKYWELGSGAYGPRRLKARMALAPASPKSGPSPSTETSIFDRVTSTLSCQAAPVWADGSLILTSPTIPSGRKERMR